MESNLALRRLARLCFLIALGAGFLLVPSAIAAPSNDNFANAAVLTGLTGSTSGTTVDATVEPGEYEPGSGHTVWYRWTAPASTMVTLVIRSWEFPAILSIWKGASLGVTLNGVPATFVGDLDEGQYRRSFQAEAGTEYRFRVSTNVAATGAFKLRWFESVNDPAPQPANDAFDSPQELTGMDGSVAGTTVTATTEDNEQNQTGGGGGSVANEARHSVWYTWVAPATGRVQLRTEGTNFDTWLGLYAGSTMSNLSLVDVNDNYAPWTTESRTFPMPVTAGVQYRIWVSGKRFKSGTFTLRWHMTAPNGDNQDPSLTVTNPGTNGPTVSRTYSVTADATDNVAVDRIQVSISTQNAQSWWVGNDYTEPYSVPFDTTVLPDGLYHFSVTSFDTAGNQSFSDTRPVVFANATFADVPSSNPFSQYILKLYDLGITTGCGTNGSAQRIFCPSDPVPRQQMAAFLVRAKGLSQLTPATPTFADVPQSNPFYGYVERLYQQGITTGCGTNGLGQLIFCPSDFVPRQQMAAFLMRAKGLTQLPSDWETFADVPTTNPFYGWIERLYEQRVTTGCALGDLGRRSYCPADTVPREQMAAFLIRAFAS